MTYLLEARGLTRKFGGVVAVCTENLSPGVVVVKSAKDGV